MQKVVKEKEKEFFVSHAGSKAKVLEIYESFSGWYWYITEKTDKEEYFGLVRGMETEWGYIWMPELEELIKKYKVWKVERKDWIGVPLLTSA